LLGGGCGHSTSSPFGNIDHVVVGPGGVFALDVAFVHGDELVGWLGTQPPRMRPEQVAAIAAVIWARAELDDV
jgi:hypothetical protein